MIFFRKNRIKFKDKFANSFYLYPRKDSIETHKKRKSVTDATNIINYLYRSNIKISIGIDIGANIGAVSVAMWDVISDNQSRIYSIEADPNNINRIHENLGLNKKSVTNIINLAISDQSGQINLTYFPYNNGWQTISKEVGSYAQGIQSDKLSINTNTLENLLCFYDLEDIDLIKIDIEGAELMALKSIKHRLGARGVKRVIFEVNQMTLEPFGESINSLLQFWSNLPYTLKVIAENGDLENLESYLEKGTSFFDCIAELNI